MLVWTKDFETGSPKLDQQHRLLIDNINLLEELIENPSPGREELDFAVFVVEYLEAYANIHFRHEEHCMEACHCPAHALNQQEHQHFRAAIQDYRRLSQRKGFSPDLLRSLHTLMHAWATNHILKVDTQLKPCLAASKDFSPATSPRDPNS